MRSVCQPPLVEEGRQARLETRVTDALAWFRDRRCAPSSTSDLPQSAAAMPAHTDSQARRVSLERSR